MNFIDTHFHLDLWSNPKEIANQIEEAGVYTIAVTNTPSVFDYTYELCKDKKYLRPALGLHPELIYERAGELPLFLRKITLTRYIGEVGLDFSTKHYASKDAQIRVFSKIIDACSIDDSKILTIHSRKSEKTVIDIVGPDFPGKVIMHWYSGSNKQLDRALDLGFYFSINSSMTKSKRGVEIIKRIPYDRILTESDGPFSKTMGEISTPLNIKSITPNIEKLANDELISIQNQVYKNFKHLLG